MPRKSSIRLTIDFAYAPWSRLKGLEERLYLAFDTCCTALPPRLRALAEQGSFALLLTSDARIHKLNRDWRGKDSPTNVLSFPFFDPPALRKLKIKAGCEPLPLGDIAIAYQTMRREAKAEEKEPLDHVTHLLIHGLLHIMGYDHMNAKEAALMEKKEIVIMKKMGLSDPYALASLPKDPL